MFTVLHKIVPEEGTQYKKKVAIYKQNMYMGVLNMVMINFI